MSDLIYFESEITRTLDATLAQAEFVQAPVATMSGLSGSGKTSATLAWLEHNQLPNVYYSACSHPFRHVEVEYFKDLSSGVFMLSGDEMKKLLTQQKKTIDFVFSPDDVDKMDDAVVVIDHYDLAGDKRPQLLEFIRNCRVTDPRAKDNGFVRSVKPKMIVVIFDSSNTDDFTETERRLFGVE